MKTFGKDEYWNLYNALAIAESPIHYLAVMDGEEDLKQQVWMDYCKDNNLDPESLSMEEELEFELELEFDEDDEPED